MKFTARKRWGLLRTRKFATAAIGLLIGGCAAPLAPPIRTGEPIGVQLMRAEPSYVGEPFRVLLDFESASDLAFLTDLQGGKLEAGVVRDVEVAHTGLASLRVAAGSAGRGFAVKLGSLLSAGDFPNGWTLAGAYFISRDSEKVEISYEVEGKPILRRSVTLEPRKWNPVMLDLSTLSDPNAPPVTAVGALKFKFAGGEVFCDDVVLLDNAKPLVAESDKAGDRWTVRRRGFTTIIERPGSFKLNVPTPEAEANGWRVEEANELRVRLVSADGKRLWTVYVDGRQYVDGKVRSAMELPPDQLALLEAQQETPAELSVPEELGRVERNAPGDRNHDGYAEATGAYQLKANGPRFEATITPRTPKLVRPVLEIAGLPEGQVVVNLEGRLVDRSVRLANGHVLVELPATISRPVTVNLRVQ